MSSAQSPQRYPKRKRVQVSYKEMVDDGELGDALPVQDDPDDEIDWKTAGKKSRKFKARNRKRRAVAKRHIFPFMKLPPEMRNNIYRHSLQTPGGVNLALQGIMPYRPRRLLIQGTSAHSGFDWFNRGLLAAKSSRNLGLLRVSKQIYSEAVGFVYRQEFTFKNLPAIWNFLHFLSPETKNLLRHIEVKLSEHEWNFLPPILLALPVQGGNLERLKIHNLGHHAGTGSVSKHLKATGRPPSTWGTTLKDLDKIIGIALAKHTYDFMWVFVIKFVPDKGIDKFVDMLDLFKAKPTLGYKFFSVEHHFTSNVRMEPWSEARATRARSAMIEELVDIMARDNA